MNNLPKDWKIVQLKDIFERVTRKNEENNSNALTISAQQGLINQKEYFNKIVASKDLSNYYLLHNGEFAYNKSYSAGYPMGVIKRLDRYDKGVLSTLYICFRINSNQVSTDYVLEYFSAGNFDKEISTIAQEGARNHGLLNVGVKDFFNLQMILPPHEEQKKIADILSTIDKKIAFVEENINVTEELKKGLMQKLLTEGIGHTEFKDSELGRIPKSWEIDILNNLSKVTDSLHMTPEFEEEGFPMVRVADIKNGKLNLSNALKVSKEMYELFTKSYIPKKKDIVLSRVGSYGVSSFVDTEEPFCMGQNTVIINPKIDSFYLYSILNSEEIKKQIENLSYGSGYKSLSLKNIRELKIKLPPLEEQKQIAEILSTVDNKLENLKEKKQSFEELKKGLMQKLLTGEVRV
ncbi:MAG: restriction endonuclease subunit S [Arcobacteraceae bacterium]